MNKLIVQVEFSKELYDFLKAIGFTNILSLGVNSEERVNNGELSFFRLQPLKPNDPRINYEETDFIIYTIGSNKVLDMLHGIDFISFMMELPFDVFELFFKTER